MKYGLYAALSVLLFGLGAFVWKAKHTGLLGEAPPAPVLPAPEPAGEHGEAVFHPPAVVLEIAGEKIHRDDIEWEYELLTEGVFDKESMTPIPDLGPRYHEELGTLKKALVASLVERKVLYAYANQDKSFDAKDPGRFEACMAEWQDAVQSGSRVVKTRENRARLKARLCERSLLKQYVDEAVFSRIKVQDAEVFEYYKNHVSEYRRPERVVIRQILLADESAAKKARNQVNAGNFESLARTLSIAPEAARGGKLGPFAKGHMPNVFDVAFHMKKGEISPILKSPYGYHVIMVVDRLPASQASLEEVAPSIASLLRKKREEEAYQQLVERALAAVSVSTPAPLW